MYGKRGEKLEYTTIKVRLYPDAAQAELFEKTFGCCRYIWNRMLADQQRFYLETGVHFLPTPAKYKDEAPFLREVDNQALVQEHNKLSQAFRVFFKSPEDFNKPRFKRKKDDKDSFTACNHVFDSGPTIYLTKDGVRMTKAGIVRAKIHRRPQNGWQLKRITVEKSRTGKYYGSLLFAFRAPETAASPVLTEENTLGLKYSASRFYVAGDGSSASLPPGLRDTQEKLAKLQRRIRRMEDGSKNQQEARRKLRLLQERLANQRKDFIHKESRRIANAWDAVCVRDESLPELARLTWGNRNLGYGMFRECLRYKLARQGKTLIQVERYVPVTRTCSACGLVQEAIPCRRPVWTCPGCGEVHNREVNAARNIQAQGLTQYCKEKRRESA